MKIKSKKELKVTLELNEEEANWLKDIVQNPIHGEHIDRESVEDRTMRAKFWGAITNALGEET